MAQSRLLAIARHSAALAFSLVLLSSALVSPATAAAKPTLTLMPAATVVGVGGTNKFFPVWDADGSGPGLPQYVDPTLVRWFSSNSGVLVVDPTGLAYGKKAGTATVYALYKWYFAKAVVTVAGTLSSLSLQTPADGRTRTYLLYVPASYHPGTATPLVLGFHGGGGNGRAFMHQTQLNTVAHQKGFLVAYPDGTGATQARMSWNGGGCCWDAMDNGVDDVGFTSLLIDAIGAQYTVDPSRVYATGFSNGAILAHRLGAELSDRIAAIAAVGAGVVVGGDFVPAPPTRHVPVLQFSGTTDEDFPYSPAIPETINWWLLRNGMLLVPSVVSYQKGIETCETSASTDSPVTLCTADPPVKISYGGILYDGGGHAWPGGVSYVGGDIPTYDIYASPTIWAFFSSYPMP
jgi:polyhydroxybutyrate depolymerase